MRPQVAIAITVAQAGLSVFRCAGSLGSLNQDELGSEEGSDELGSESEEEEEEEEEDVADQFAAASFLAWEGK